MNILFARLAAFAPFLTEGETDGGLGGMLLTLIPMGLVIVAFYFFLIRPENKRKKESAKMRKEIIVGDEITTIGGIVGKVVSIKDDMITIESGAEKSRIKVMRWAVSSKGQQVSDG